VSDLLVASDAEWVHRDIRSVLSGPGTTVRSVYSGAAVLPAVHEHLPDLAVLDLQIGNMGAMAVSLELRLEEGAGRLDHVPVLILLDRRPDVFLARRSDAEGWLMKPIDPIRLRRAARAILDGGTYFDTSYLPDPVSVPARSSTVEDSGK
jgi:two-component system nitrate/nitrite response regulator NarL